MNRLAFLILFSLVLGAFYSANAQTGEELRSQRYQSFQTMVAGQPMQAAADLLEVIRGLPAEDPSIADIACGNLQLLIFDVNFLMDDRMRQDFFTKTLDTRNLEIDSLIVTLHEASVPKSTPELEAFLMRLWQFSRSSNDFVAVVALYLLSNPYYSADTEAGFQASHEMAARYPGLEATRSMLVLPIYKDRDKRAVAGEWIRAYQGKRSRPGKARRRETTQAEKNVIANDPFITKLEPVLDYMEEESTRRMGIDGVLKLLDEEPDWHDRYGYLRMLEPEMKAPPGGAGAQGYWKHIKPAIEALANREALTPDVYRARVMLCRVACDARDFDEAGYWAERVLTEQDRPDESPERILYEEAVKTYQSYAGALVDNGQPERGAEAFERLAGFFPNSALAAECVDMAGRVRQGVK